MHLGEPAGKNAKRVVRAILGGLAVLYVILFWNEIRWVLGFPPDFVFDPASEAGRRVLLPGEFVPFTCVLGFGVVFIVWMVLISFQALLPISNIMTEPGKAILEAYRASWYLMFHILRLHGPAIFVRDGMRIETSEDLHRDEWPGVVVVDFNSAVVLEERNAPPGLNGAFTTAFVGIFELLRVFDPRESPRVRGSGIIFTRPGERIRGTVDLRRQWRMQPKVRCYTRDGIELYANVWAMFTVGQDADILQVTYVSIPAPENLRVVRLNELPNGYIRISGFSDELDASDKREIHEFWQNGLVGRNGIIEAPVFVPYRPFEPLDDTFSQRVYSAVCSQARTSSGQEFVDWTELPARVAAGFYRDILSQVNYDQLYNIREEGVFPLPTFRNMLNYRMRNNGILAFRLIQLANGGRNITGEGLVRGRIYSPEQLLVSQVRRLQNPKPLRDRGIRVIASRFSDLFPVNEEVYRQRLDAWRASWDSDLHRQLAGSEYDAIRAAGRARVKAQQDLWQSLAMLFEQEDFAEEALALRVLQALDQAAADPQTRALLPANIMDAMRYVNSLLLPNNRPSGGQLGIPPAPQPGPPPSTPPSLPGGNGGGG